MHPLAAVPVGLLDPPIVRRRSDLSLNAQGRQALALQGCWQTILDKLPYHTPTSLPEKLSCAAYKVLGLFKLRNYAAAMDALQALGDLDAPQYTRNTPNGPESMVPFALRLLAAEIPTKLGKPKVTLDALYKLYSYCGKQLESSADRPAAGENDDGVVASKPATESPTDLQATPNNELKSESASAVASSTSAQAGSRANGGPQGCWVRRRELVAWSLVNHHLEALEFHLALNWLNSLLEMKPADAQVWFAVVCVQLMLGDMATAKDTCRQLDDDRPLCQLALGLCAFAEQDYKGAISAFDIASENKQLHCAAVNNKALCQLCQCNLPGALSTVEIAIHNQPCETMQERLISTLWTLYDLKAAESSRDSKLQLAGWLSRCTPDDFDKGVAQSMWT